jgi:uncharacterized protein
MYCFDSGSCSVFEIDRITYDILKLVEHPNPKTVSKVLKYPDKKIHEVLSEIKALRAAGYLAEPVDESPSTVTQYINQLMHTNSNSVTLIVADTCDLHCRYCYEQGVNKSSRCMSKKTARDAVDFLFERAQKRNSVEITFFGGEPLLNWDTIKAVISYSQALGMKQGKKVFYSLTTNGVHVSPEVIDYIKKYNFGLMVSLDGPKQIQDAVRPFKDGKGSYECVMEKLKLLMDKRRMVTVRATLCKENKNLNQLIQFFENVGFTRIAVGWATGKSYHKGPFDLNSKDMDHLLREYEIARDRAIEQLHNGEPLVYDPLSDPIHTLYNRTKIGIRCGAGRGTIAVGINGHIYPCHRYIGMDKYILGDIYSGINEKCLFAYLNAYYAVKKYCQSCWLRIMCGGPCPWYVSHEDGTIREPDHFTCEMNRKSMERCIWAYSYVREKYPDFFRTAAGIRGEKE